MDKASLMDFHALVERVAHLEQRLMEEVSMLSLLSNNQAIRIAMLEDRLKDDGK